MIRAIVKTKSDMSLIKLQKKNQVGQFYLIVYRHWFAAGTTYRFRKSYVYVTKEMAESWCGESVCAHSIMNLH